MRDLIEQERFELEVLDKLKSGRILERLVFCGGTMLRLCFGLNRYSVDLDFQLKNKEDAEQLRREITEFLGADYTVTDSADKFNTILVEIKSAKYPRRLKIEIRKKTPDGATEPAIAYSPSADRQVYVDVVPLPDMMRSKIAAFLERKEIRDAFDIEFLLKKGIELEASPEDLGKLGQELDALTARDYAIKLGSILEERDRDYYKKKNFTILRSAIASGRAVSSKQ